MDELMEMEVNDEANRDQLVEDFKSCTGYEDDGTCRAHLEAANWDLLAAINNVTSVESQTLPADAGGNAELIAQYGNATSDSRIYGAPGPPYRSRSPEVIVAPIEDSGPDANFIFFRVNCGFRNTPLEINLPDSETVGSLKNQVYAETGIPPCQQDLQGWPPDRFPSFDNQSLRSIGLPPENDILLFQNIHNGSPVAAGADTSESSHDVSVGPGPSKSSSQPQAGTSNFPTSKSASVIVRPSSGNGVVLHVSVVSQLGLTELPPLSSAQLKTVADVKEWVSSRTGIPSPLQVWEGWPPSAVDDSLLESLGLSSPHGLRVSKLEQPIPVEREVGTSSGASSIPLLPLQPRRADVATSIPMDDHSIHEVQSDSSIDDTYFPLDDSLDVLTSALETSPSSDSARHAPLIPEGVESELDGVIRFQEGFNRRYGPLHPIFYPGTLDDAVTHSLNVSARDRRMLALYLHHDKSILANVFCSQALCAESIVEFLNAHFTVWGWDMTFASNRETLVNSVGRLFGQVAASTLSSISTGSLPAVLIVTKLRGNFEVVSIIHGDASADVVMSSLLHALEVFNQQQAEAVREEDDRALRDRVKREQDEAFELSLAIDRAKEAERKEQEAKEKEKEKVQEMKELKRRQLKDSLPPEPSKTEEAVELRFRIPGGERQMLQRRFRAKSPVRDVFTYLAAEGYPVEEYKLLTAFPKRDISESEPSTSLAALKLHPQETLNLAESLLAGVASSLESFEGIKNPWFCWDVFYSLVFDVASSSLLPETDCHVICDVDVWKAEKSCREPQSDTIFCMLEHYLW